jgi:hypothetical protein
MGYGTQNRTPSPEQQDEFIQLIAQGKTRQEAALTVGSTASAFRGFIFRNEEFGERYRDALEQSGNPESPLHKQIDSLEKLRLLERMLDEYIMRALDSEKGKVGSSNRALQNMLTLMHDTFKPFLEARTRHIHEGSVGVFAMPQIDTAKWSIEEHKEFVDLRRRMNELLLLARPEGAQGFPELEAAPPEDNLGDDEDEGTGGVREPREPHSPLGSGEAEAEIIEDAAFEEVA